MKPKDIVKYSRGDGLELNVTGQEAFITWKVQAYLALFYDFEQKQWVKNLGPNSTFLLVKKALKLFQTIEAPSVIEQKDTQRDLRERGLLEEGSSTLCYEFSTSSFDC